VFEDSKVATVAYRASPLNDEERWVEATRLTVVIDAPRQAIDSVIGQYEIIQQLPTTAGCTWAD
jgi:uncharacterized protein YbcC (UPF0753/DUF2309 family)